MSGCGNRSNVAGPGLGSSLTSGSVERPSCVWRKSTSGRHSRRGSLFLRELPLLEGSGPWPPKVMLPQFQLKLWPRLREETGATACLQRLWGRKLKAGVNAYQEWLFPSVQPILGRATPNLLPRPGPPAHLQPEWSGDRRQPTAVIEENRSVPVRSNGFNHSDGSQTSLEDDPVRLLQERDGQAR